MIDTSRGLAALFLATLVAVCLISCSSDETVILASGTTPYDTGFLDALVPLFEADTGFHLKVIAVGTGQALEMGRRGDADVLLVHNPAAEQDFMDEGYGVDRQFVMYNDFVIVGPNSDPAEIDRADDAAAAMDAMAGAEASFVSRADDSGTNLLERSLWDEIDVDPAGEDWYIEAGQGMGATLQIASQRGAYTISDRGTFLALEDTLDLTILLENDPRLINLYHVIEVNPETVDGTNSEGGSAFAEFLVSSQAQAVMAQFGVPEFGQPLFMPAAGLDEADVTGTSQGD